MLLQNIRGLKVPPNNSQSLIGESVADNFREIGDRAPPNNYSADGPPTADDDVTVGYYVNSLWLDTTANVWYRNRDNTAGAAVWDVMVSAITTATTLYVSPTGNDTTGTGSAAAPWATVGRAIEYLNDKFLAADITIQLADGATRPRTYDQASLIVGLIDENGSEITYEYDPLSRLIVLTGLGITSVDDVTQTFEYDGLSRPTNIDEAFAGQSLRNYDSLSRLVEDYSVITGVLAAVTKHAFASLVESGFTFPNGRQLTNVYDVLYRRIRVEETSGGANIAAWDFFGPGRVAETRLGDDSGPVLVCTFMNNARNHSAVQPTVPNPAWGDRDSTRLGYDGAGRMITKRYLLAGTGGGGYTHPSAVVGFTTNYDQASNKTYERHLHAEGRSHLYDPYPGGVSLGGYDSANRLRQYQRGALTSDGGIDGAGGGTVATAISLPNASIERRYDLDGVGNWRREHVDPVSASPYTEIRQHNNVNEITRIKVASTTTLLSSDANGNLTNDGTYKYRWDVLNRLTKVSDAVTDDPIVAMQYDPIGRRLQKAIYVGGVLDGHVLSFYDGWRCVQDGNNDAIDLKLYTWGIYLDELIQMRTSDDVFNLPAGDYYPLQDLLYRTVGLADSAGVVREAYDCDAYGNTLIFRDASTPPDPITYTDADNQVSACCNEFIFTGQRWDAESAAYYYKMRYYSPQMGRFISRDPLPIASFLNLYTYVSSGPTSSADSYGLIPMVLSLPYQRYPTSVGEKALAQQELVAQLFPHGAVVLYRELFLGQPKCGPHEWVEWNRDTEARREIEIDARGNPKKDEKGNFILAPLPRKVYEFTRTYVVAEENAAGLKFTTTKIEKLGVKIGGHGVAGTWEKHQPVLVLDGTLVLEQVFQLKFVMYKCCAICVSGNSIWQYKSCGPPRAISLTSPKSIFRDRLTIRKYLLGEVIEGFSEIEVSGKVGNVEVEILIGE